MKTYLSLILILLFGTVVQAQDYAVLKEVVKDNPLNTAFVGYVVDENDLPVVGARVTLLDIDGRLINETETKDNGSFVLKNIEKGKYLLQAISRYMLTEVKNVSMDLEVRSAKTQIRSVGRVPLSIKIEESKDVPIAELSEANSEGSVFDKLPANVLVGSVLDEVGKDIVGATVILKKKDGEFMEKTQTSEKGTYVFQDLKNGTYIIQAKMGNFTSESREIIVNFEETSGFKAQAAEALVIGVEDYEIAGDSKKVKAVSKEEFMKDISLLMKHQGRPFPTFALKDYSDKEWTNNDLKGKITVMFFWHAGCKACLEEIPELNTWIGKYPEVSFMSCTWNSLSGIDKIINSKPFLFIHLVNGQSLFDALNVKMTPTTFIVDERGIIRSIIPGLNETSSQKIIAELENRLSKK